MKVQLTKEQISQIISIVISALIALLAVFGYDVGIMQPRLAALGAPVASSQTLTKFDYLQTAKLTVGASSTLNGTTTAVNLTATTITATNLVSQTVGFSTTYVTSTNGSLTNATVTTATMTSLTATGATITSATLTTADVTTATVHSVYPVLYAADNNRFYVGSGTITGTSVLTTSTHGLATIRWASCQLTDAPAAGAAAFMCKPSWSGTTVTFTNYTITPSVTSAAGAITYAVFGSP